MLRNKSQSQSQSNNINFDKWKTLGISRVIIDTKKNSQHILPTLTKTNKNEGHNKQIHKYHSEGTNKKQLSQAIARFNYYHQNEKDLVQVGKAGFKVIQAFGKVQNNFKDLFIALSSSLKNFCCYNFDLDFEIKKEFSLHFSEFENINESTSFREIVYLMKNSFINLKQTKDNEIIQRQKYESQMQMVIKNKYNTIQKLKETIKYYMTNSNQNIKFQFEELTRQFKEMEQELRRVYRQRDKLYDELEQAQNKNSKYQKEIMKLREQLSVFDVKMDQLKDKTIQQQQLFQNRFKKFKDMIDQLFLKTASLADQIKKVKKENEMLTTQRIQFVARSSVSFDQLTPRPKYHKYLGTKFQYMQSTDKIMKTLIQKMQLLPTEKKLLFSKKPQNKMQMAQQIASQTLKTLSNIKNQIRQQFNQAL